MIMGIVLLDDEEATVKGTHSGGRETRGLTTLLITNRFYTERIRLSISRSDTTAPRPIPVVDRRTSNTRYPVHAYRW